MKKTNNFPTKKELREMKRQEVMRRAADRFGKYGYANVSLGDIAADLNVTKAALYSYTSSKSDLLLQCYQDVMDDLIAAMQKAAAIEGTAAERLHLALEAYILVMTRQNSQYLWANTRPDPVEERGRVVQAQRDKIDCKIRALLVEGKNDGSLRSDLEPKLASLVLLGAVNWVGIWYQPDGDLSAQQLAQQVISEAMLGYLT